MHCRAAKYALMIRRASFYGTDQATMHDGEEAFAFVLGLFQRQKEKESISVDKLGAAPKASIQNQFPSHSIRQCIYRSISILEM